MEYISIYGNSSNLLKINFGVPQGSVLGPLLFFYFINDLHSSIRYSSPFHSADDAGLLNIQDNIRAIGKTLNKYLKELSFCLNANIIFINVTKTKTIIFKTRNKNFKLCRKRIHASLYVKYLSLFIYENSSCKAHINKISTKLIRAKLQHSLNKDILLSLYYATFHSY